MMIMMTREFNYQNKYTVDGFFAVYFDFKLGLLIERKY